MATCRQTNKQQTNLKVIVMISVNKAFNYSLHLTTVLNKATSLNDASDIEVIYLFIHTNINIFYLIIAIFCTNAPIHKRQIKLILNEVVKQ